MVKSRTIKILEISLCLFLLSAILLFGENLKKTPSTNKEEDLLEETKLVLYISSYSPSVFTFDQQIEGIKKRFGNNKKIKLDVEYMDTKDFNTEGNLQNFYNSLKYKIRNGKKYDAVIVGDDNGLLWLMEKKRDLFPDIPLFFLGINNFETARKAQQDPLITGVVEAKSFDKTVHLAKLLNPEAKRVIAIIDNTTSSLGAYRELLEQKKNNPDLDFSSIDISTMTFDEFFIELEKIGKEDIVFYNAAVTDKTGLILTWEDLHKRIDSILDVPIFGAVNYGIGEGVFGGCVISHVDQGYTAADMVMRYFLGTKMRDIEFSTESPNAYILDYKQFKEFNYSFDVLPEDVVWVNQSYSFWARYRQVILIAIGLMIIEAIIIIILIFNIKKRRRIEIALRESKERLRSYIENAPDGIYIINEESRIIDVNQASCLNMGFSREELLELSIYDLVIDKKQTKEKLTRAFIEGSGSGELEYLTKSGEKRFCSIDAVKFEERNFLIFSKDITLRKEAESEKAQLEEQLHHSRKMDAIGQLAGGVAHDFNNILTGIIGATQVLENLIQNPGEKTLHYLNLIMKASFRASTLNAKLLAFSRKSNISSDLVDINEIVNDSLSILDQTIDRGIDISSHLTAENYHVLGDDSALQGALINLCINAAHAMPEGGSLIVSTSNIVLDEDYCVNNPFHLTPGEFIDIEVRDTGSGILKENLEKIFEPFYTTKEVGKGTGLGLSAVYGTIQDHSGSITVYSEPGMGTVFHLLIPCSESKNKEEKSLESSMKGTGTILLVDDEELIRKTTKFNLEKMDYTVITANNGEAAVDLFREKYREIDLIVMDMIMPKMNGSDAFKQMKEIDPNCKVIISSGFIGGERISELKGLGLVGFIEKPFRTHELLSLIRKALESFN